MWTKLLNCPLKQFWFHFSKTSEWNSKKNAFLQSNSNWHWTHCIRSRPCSIWNETSSCTYFHESKLNIIITIAQSSKCLFSCKWLPTNVENEQIPKVLAYIERPNGSNRNRAFNLIVFRFWCHVLYYSLIIFAFIIHSIFHVVENLACD